MAPFVIGIGGGTGSGKSTLARQLAASEGWRTASPALDGHAAGRTLIIEHDAYYRDLSHLSLDARSRINFDDPDALETSLLAEHLAALRAGQSIDGPVYDFSTHTRLRETRRLDPADLVVVEGILVLADDRLRALFDLKVFVDADADVRILRRLTRDVRERGRTVESVGEQYFRTVRPMHVTHVEPSKRWADLVVSGEGDPRVALEMLLDAVARARRTS